MFTNLWIRFRGWFFKRWPLILVIGLVILSAIVPTLFNQSMYVPSVYRMLGSSTQHVNVLWLRQDVSSYPIASAGGRIFAMSLDGNSLISTDMRTGATLWQDGLTFEHSDARGLLANDETVFVITTLSADAYDAKTGQFKWSTMLGQGHVTIISQLDLGVVRVYYGDTIYELDSETGKMLAIMPKGNIVWVSGNIVLKTSTSDQYEWGAYDRQTGALLWNQGPVFFVDEGDTPLVLSKDILIVSSWSSFGGICALDLQTGKYNWCRPEGYNSMAAIDVQSQLGYAMRDDLTLLTIDLHTGDVLGETSFLSSKPFNKDIGSICSVTVGDGVVIVSFGDSMQTLALKYLP